MGRSVHVEYSLGDRVLVMVQRDVAGEVAPCVVVGEIRGIQYLEDEKGNLVTYSLATTPTGNGRLLATAKDIVGITWRSYVDSDACHRLNEPWEKADAEKEAAPSNEELAS